MDEFVCLTLLAKPGEPEPGFKSRLVAFWSDLLRNRPDDYEQVYAEAREFEREGDRVARRYMVAPGVLVVLTGALAGHGIDYLPVDEDDTYSRAEASSSEWFQVEH
jgi:hypothetical protein